MVFRVYERGMHWFCGKRGIMTREEMLACLTDRPCDVCKFHTEKGCGRWSCVFEEEPDDSAEPKTIINNGTMNISL